MCSWLGGALSTVSVSVAKRATTVTKCRAREAKSSASD